MVPLEILFHRDDCQEQQRTLVMGVSRRGAWGRVSGSTDDRQERKNHSRILRDVAVSEPAAEMRTAVGGAGVSSHTCSVQGLRVNPLADLHNP